MGKIYGEADGEIQPGFMIAGSWEVNLYEKLQMAKGQTNYIMFSNWKFDYQVLYMAFAGTDFFFCVISNIHVHFYLTDTVMNANFQKSLCWWN